jgi:hypothetical protein
MGRNIDKIRDACRQMVVTNPKVTGQDGRGKRVAVRANP